MDRRTFLKLTGLTAGALALSNSKLVGHARALIPQTPLPGNKIPQFVDPLPDLHTIIAGTGQIELQMTEFAYNMMPTGFMPAVGSYAGTSVWGYLEAGQPTIPSYIGPVIVATRDIPTEIKWVNNLGYADPVGLTGSDVVAYTQSTDQTLHWAHPNIAPQTGNYDGPIPAVPHLHGGEVPPEVDGGPDAWFLSHQDPAYTTHGHAYHSKAGAGALVNEAIYRYPNSQEAANIWFHDHTLGATRLGVYAGLAGAYLLSDSNLTLPTGLTPHGLGSTNTNPLLGDEAIIPLVIQDRMFDINGQLFFPNVGINPEHPFWVPEFEGDTIVVNGKVWPFKELEPKRYRFLFLNGSNARTYELFMVDPTGGDSFGPSMWVIGTDGGYLDTPVKIDPALGQKLTIMPGERYDVIMDFTAFLGKTLQMRNIGRTPYPKGPTPNGKTLGRIMEFRVGTDPATDISYDPATSGDPLRSGDQEIIRLVDPVAGTASVTPDVIRQLTLNEVMGPGGPLEVLVNNTKWGGHSVATDIFPGGIRDDFKLLGNDTYYSEMPVEGQTELWEIVNITADAHPIHLHLIQFQLMNRQKFRVGKYNKDYNALFPGSDAAIDPMTNLPYTPGVFIGGFGPPLNYNTGGGTHPVYGMPIRGGNPDITSYLQGPIKPPLAYEAGWKDTVIMYPGDVTRIMVRYTPTHVPVGTPSTDSAAAFPFSPNGGHGYVWHCHIIDHEDNEMMRPKSVTNNTAAPLPADRAYTKENEDY